MSYPTESVYANGVVIRLESEYYASITLPSGREIGCASPQGGPYTSDEERFQYLYDQSATVLGETNQPAAA